MMIFPHFQNGQPGGTGRSWVLHVQRGCRNTLIIFVVLGATVLFAVLLGMALYYASRHGTPIGGGGVVALIEIKGDILEVEGLLEEIRDRRRDERVKALVVRIDSPGGAVGPSQEVYRELEKTSENGKLVVASMGAVAASGGYYIACAADQIFANPGTITGSIGVIFLSPNIQGLMNKLGISYTTLKTGEYKDSGSPLRPMTEEERRVLEATLYDAYAQFVEHVAAGRHLDPAQVKELADGRIYTGRQALGHGLIDKEGTLLDAIAYAGREVGIGEEPRVVKREKRRFGPFELADSLSRLVPEASQPRRPGLYYLWP